MPAVGIAPEWMSEKAIAIGCCFAASGVPVIFGGESPVAARLRVAGPMTEVWFERFKGALHFENPILKRCLKWRAITSTKARRKA